MGEKNDAPQGLCGALRARPVTSVTLEGCLSIGYGVDLVQMTTEPQPPVPWNSAGVCAGPL